MAIRAEYTGTFKKRSSFLYFCLNLPKAEEAKVTFLQQNLSLDETLEIQHIQL